MKKKQIEQATRALETDFYKSVNEIAEAVGTTGPNLYYYEEANRDVWKAFRVRRAMKEPAEVKVFLPEALAKHARQLGQAKVKRLILEAYLKAETKSVLSEIAVK